MQQHCSRAVAGSFHNVKEAQVRIMGAMGPDIPMGDLQTAGVFMRLDLMIATSMLEKFANIKRNRRLPVQHTHFLSKVNRVEHSCPTQQRLLAGREMIRAICVWCS
eukprot:9209652-Pyramimonas_sp.AAC.1